MDEPQQAPHLKEAWKHEHGSKSRVMSESHNLHGAEHEPRWEDDQPLGGARECNIGKGCSGLLLTLSDQRGSILYWKN